MPMRLFISRVCDGPDIIKRWYGQIFNSEMSLMELFGKFRDGEVDGIKMADKYIGCQVEAKVSKEASSPEILVAPETTLNDCMIIRNYITFPVSPNISSESSTTPVIDPKRSAFAVLMNRDKSKSF